MAMTNRAVKDEADELNGPDSLLYEPLRVYLADVSYFSGKLEALLRYKEIPFERVNASVGDLVNKVYPHTGLMKVPVVRLANGQWLKDTTPMFDWLESNFPQHSIMPEDPVDLFMSKLIEDYADEWCWRSAMFWRWRYPETRQLLAQRISEEVLSDWPLPKKIGAWYFAQRQTKTFLEGDGVSSKTEPYVRNHYYHLLCAMKVLLRDQPFLLGNRPSLVDFAFFGPMFRLFSLDPAPAQVMREEAPEVYEWVARMWNVKGSGVKGRAHQSDFSHKGWHYFLKDIMKTYWPMLLKNAEAWLDGRAVMDFANEDVSFSNLKVVHYRVYCLEVLQDLYCSLNKSDRLRVDTLLAPYGRLVLMEGLDSGLKEDYQLPLDSEARPVNLLQKLSLMATGTPWDKPFGRLFS